VKGIGGDVGERTVLKTPDNGFEALIGNKMKLRGDEVGVDVPDEPDG
jgi:hypothetical protein